MRAALGLALLFGGSVLALYVLSGRVPFAATSAASGGAAHVTGSPTDAGVGTASGATVGRVMPWGGLP